MSEFYIVNGTVRPYKRHVAQAISEDRARYLHDDLRDSNKLIIDELSTNLKDFGFKIVEKEDVVKFFLSGKSTAKYYDGRPRKWQGESMFELKKLTKTEEI